MTGNELQEVEGGWGATSTTGKYLRLPPLETWIFLLDTALGLSSSGGHFTFLALTL